MMFLEQIENCFRLNPRVIANNGSVTLFCHNLHIITLQGSVHTYTRWSR